jgi:hypothetical protein
MEGQTDFNVFHPVVCYNNSKSKTNQSNTTLVIILDCVSKLATCFGLARGHHQAILLENIQSSLKHMECLRTLGYSI